MLPPDRLDLQLHIDRDIRQPVAEQISAGLRTAIREGQLAPGARLPSWRDLSSQLGVARGTVRSAYERLIDQQLIVSAGAAGTRVAPAAVASRLAHLLDESPPIDAGASGSPPPLVFQMGVPAADAFPTTLWARALGRAVRRVSTRPPCYPDPRGEPALRSQIAAYLALARGLNCTPAQVFITSGHASALALVVGSLGLADGSVWTEDPGYPLTRKVLAGLDVRAVPVPVDEEGLDVDRGMLAGPQAMAAVVTPGQQAPFGVAMSLRRRHALLAWANQSRAWILEDDYLSELQLNGRAVPALGSLDRDGRVLHLGTFSKTLSPALRLGFVVVPPGWVDRFGEVAATWSPPPAPVLQMAVAEFMEGGHYLRHLRRMKRLYRLRRDALMACLGKHSITHRASGLTVLLRVPPGLSDVALAQEAGAHDLAPAPLSPWYGDLDARQAGLLLNVANVRELEAEAACSRLLHLVHR